MKVGLLSPKFAFPLVGILFVLSGCASSDRSWATQPPTAPEIQLPDKSPLRGAFQAGAMTRADALSKNSFCGGLFDNWTQETRRSLDQFLRANQMLAVSNPRYEINLRLVSSEAHTSVNFDITTTTSIQYEIIEAASQKVVLGDTVNTTYVAKLGDALDGCARAKLSAVGSTNDGIRALLTKVLTLH